jgi:wyosine [tRNA(Phe)-imidazoG37] synthetase (radical SAM superfamily)
VGRTTTLTVRRREYYEPGSLVDEVVGAVRERAPEVITFVPNGEPTLDANLGLEAREIRGKVFQPLAIISNGSLLWREDVAENVHAFDIVSVKVDTVREGTWRCFTFSERFSTLILSLWSSHALAFFLKRNSTAFARPFTRGIAEFCI